MNAILAATLLILMACLSWAGDLRPSVVVIVADDLGYETIGANGGQSYETPRLDTLAATGARFQHAYAQPLCTPTRVQLMTGKYNVRNYSEFGVMRPGQVTFANLFRDAGYKTFVGGKWQLEGGYNGPIAFGFDEYFLWQLNRRPQRYYAPGFEAHIPADGLYKTEVNYPSGVYGPDIVRDKVLQFIERNHAHPFLVYYPMMLTHSPFTPAPNHESYNPASTNELDDAIYFESMVEYMDKLIGDLVDKLNELGIRNNTIITFMGDNGTGSSITSMLNGSPMQGGKGKTTAAGIHVPLILNWPGTIPSQVNNDVFDSTDLLPTVCEAARISVPENLDGRSFMPRLLGAGSPPRPWSYCWYKPQNGTEADVKEFAQTARFKLYLSGLFYDTENDVLEQAPLNTASLPPEPQAAFDLLTQALASFSDERLARTQAPQPNPAIWSVTPVSKGVGVIGMTAGSGMDVNGPAEYQFRNVTLSRNSVWQLSPYYADHGLSDSTTYTYQVRVQDLLGNVTGWSEARPAETPASQNPRSVIIEQPQTDGSAGGQNIGQSFTVPQAQDGWFLDSITFFGATNSGGTDSAWLTLYDGFTNLTSRGRVMAVSANSALNPRASGVPIVWDFTNVVLTAGRTYFAAVSDAFGSALQASQGMPAQRIQANAYSGGERINESGLSASLDLKFTVHARRFPSSYAQWALGLPAGAPKGFGEAVAEGHMSNGWKYFLGLAPMEAGFARWPQIAGGRYNFRLDPEAADVFWRIRFSPSVQAPASSWQTFDSSHPALDYDPLTGSVQLPLPATMSGFFRLEIGLL